MLHKLFKPNNYGKTEQVMLITNQDSFTLKVTVMQIKSHCASKGNAKNNDCWILAT